MIIYVASVILVMAMLIIAILGYIQASVLAERFSIFRVKGTAGKPNKLACFSERFCEYMPNEAPSIVVFGFMLIYISLLIIGILGAVNNIDAVKQSKLIEASEERAAIVCAIETGIYGDKLDIDDRYIIDKVEAFNKSVRVAKALKNDIWYGYLVNNKYTESEIISYDMLYTKGIQQEVKQQQ